MNQINHFNQSFDVQRYAQILSSSFVCISSLCRIVLVAQEQVLSFQGYSYIECLPHSTCFLSFGKNMHASAKHLVLHEDIRLKDFYTS